MVIVPPNGNVMEWDIYSSLRKSGFTVARSWDLDNLWKVDVLLLSIPGFPVLLQERIGIQVTISMNNNAKREDFFAHAALHPDIERYLYLEIEPDTNLLEGGNAVLRSAIVEFATNRLLKKNRFGFVKIYKDLTYAFFVVPAAVQHEPTEHASPDAGATESSPAPPPPAVTETPTPPVRPPERPLLHGFILSWNKTGSWGWIEVPHGPVFHLSDKNIADRSLRQQLDEIQGTMITFKNGEFPITFRDGGPPPSLSKKKEKKRRESIALDVKSDEGCLALPSRTATTAAA